MNQRLAAAIEGIRRLPEERQAEIADFLEVLLAQAEPFPEWTEEQIEQVQQGVADADAGRFASKEEVAELFGRFRK